MVKALDESIQNELCGREPIVGTVKLRSRDVDSEVVRDEFKIVDIMHAGGSCICYKAKKIDGDTAVMGTLKEFYPVRYASDGESGSEYNLSRCGIDSGDMANQLYCGEMEREDFIKSRDEFLSCCNRVSGLMTECGESDLFFDHVNIYLGIPNDGEKENYTIYTWLPADTQIKSFEDYLNKKYQFVKSQLRSSSPNLDFRLAKDLKSIIKAIDLLASGVKILHTNSLWHLDIKPSNFGIREYEGDVQSVSLFDVNTFHSVCGDKLRTRGTPHFSAPEFKDGSLDSLSRKTDIYSLGATLYNAIIFGDSQRELYSDENFSSIDSALAHSKIIECSEYNSKAELVDILARIMKRSLARKAEDYEDGIENYDAVEEFIDDIKEAKKIIGMQITLANESGTTHRSTIVTVENEDYYDGNIDGGAISSVQRLLYDRPLYDYVTQNGEIKVLVLGAGVFGQKFIDTALELAQIENCKISVTVVSNDIETDKARYLQARPEFSNFFEVDGRPALYGKENTYGSVNFVSVGTKKGGFSCKNNNAQKLKKALHNEKFDYAFVSLSDDHLNMVIASQIANSDIFRTGEGKKAAVNFITYKEVSRDGEAFDAVFGETFDKARTKAAKDGIEINPAPVNSTIINHSDYKLLHRMALNCHLLWKKNLGCIESAKAEFCARYEFVSSFANALSIKYKLHSIGIDLSEVTSEPDKAQQEKKLKALTLRYKNKIGLGKSSAERTPEQKSCLNKLTMYEHRRWVVNMICVQAYTTLPKEEYATLVSSNKNKAKKKHTCIIPSSEEWGLDQPKWRNLKDWDKDDIEDSDEFKSLDMLDQMSVRLHRHFMTLAEKIEFGKIDAECAAVRRSIASNIQALSAFEAYIISLRTMKSMLKRTSLTRATVDNIQQAVSANSDKFKEQLSADEMGLVERALNSIAGQFEPVKLAADYTDYKAKDHDLIKGIPFILNYDTNVHLCIPFVMESDNNKWFENVASSIVINPATVTYLINCEKLDDDIDTVKEILPSISEVLDSHELQTKLSLILYIGTNNGVISEERKRKIERELAGACDKIESVHIIEYNSSRERPKKIRNTIKTICSTSRKFTAIETKNNTIGGMIDGMDDLPVAIYKFDHADMRFTSDDDDDYIWFDDIPFNVHLNIDDIFIAHDKKISYSEPELYLDYESIWEKCYYDEDTSKRYAKSQAWKKLCTAFCKKAEMCDKVFEASLSEAEGEKSETSIFVPTFCRASLEKIIEFFTSPQHCILENAKIGEHNSLMLKFSFTSTEEVKSKLLRIFENPYSLDDETRIRFNIDGDNSDKKVTMFLDSLVIPNFSWDDFSDESALEDVKEIYTYLSENGYIIPCFRDGDKVTFCFASKEIKELLTNASRILEIYTYYKTMERGYFDDMRINLKVTPKLLGAYSEKTTQKFDIVSIKGFRTQVVDVNDCRNLETGFYQGLSADGAKFAVNQKLVLVSYTGEESVSPANESVAKTAAKDYRVQTIHAKEDIKEIGGKLEDEMTKKAHKAE